MANAVTTITGRNFRLVQRLMTHITRVMTIVRPNSIAPEVVQAARRMPVVVTQ